MAAQVQPAVYTETGGNLQTHVIVHNPAGGNIASVEFLGNRRSYARGEQEKEAQGNTPP